MKTWFVAFVLSCVGVACAVPADANHTPRCSAHGTCPSGALCVSGFCLPGRHGPTDHDAAIQSELDAGTVQPANDAQIGAQMPPISERDAGSVPPEQPPDAGTPSDSSDCGALAFELCCPGSQLACNGHCVNPLKDKHHCGGCAIVCSKGPCEMGICTKDEDDD